MSEIVDGLAPGTRVGPVVLEKAIDRGGYGIVYKGVHDKYGIVAIKEFFPRLVASRSRTGDQIVHSGSAKDAEAFEKGLQKFLEEGRTLEKIEHPNVVKFHEAIEANGTAYLVMALIVGDKLSDFMVQKREKIDKEFTARLASDVASALDALHSEGLIHRDVAPDNILIENTTLRPVLIDFGGAKQVVSGHSMSSDSSLVKPGFSPPEQYPKGDVRGLERGPWSDLYGFSAVLYNLITGEEPQDAVTRMDSDLQTPAVKAGVNSAERSLLKAIDWGLKPTPQERPRTVAAWLNVANGETKPPRKISPLAIGCIAAGLAAIVAGAFLYFNPNAEAKLYNAAMAGNCSSAEQYVSEYSDGRFISEMSSMSEECELWGTVQKNDTIVSYENYLDAYPAGRFAEPAQDRIEEFRGNSDEMAWSAAVGSNTTRGYRDYINSFPRGRHLEEAKNRIAELEAEARRKTAELEAEARQKIEWTRGIQTALQSMKFNPGPVDGDWGASTHSAAAAFVRVSGYSADTSEPNQDLLAAAQRAISSRFSNVECADRQVSEQVPEKKCERVPIQREDYDSKELNISNSCTPPPFCSFNAFGQYVCDYRAAEDWCENAADHQGGDSLRRQCRNMNGDPGSVYSDCNCNQSGCYCDVEMDCDITTTKIVYEQQCDTIYRTEYKTVRECKCLAKESCPR
ncbi:MAG: serine/threonine protein kinase [Gammaproteobacteria bacterium]|nr:serine/threonine protein kinase [Gammaproteobacteria bacterium]